MHKSMIVNQAGAPDEYLAEEYANGVAPNRRCETCRFWGRAKGGMPVCRRSPAMAAMVQGPQGPAVVAVWLPTLANEWCGQWEQATPY